MTTPPHPLRPWSVLALLLLILVLVTPGACPRDEARRASKGQIVEARRGNEGTPPPTAAPEKGAGGVNARAVDGLVRGSMRAWGVPGVAVAIVRDGEVVYLKGHGVKVISSNDPVTPDTLFPIASCTKGFTTTAMALLVDEGKMAWDDPVRNHVPFFHLGDPLADQAVTLRDLVCHRTGLAGHDLLWYHSPWSPEEVIRRVGRLPLDRPFRTAFQYQSTMFTAAGFAVASAAGEPWEDFVRRRLLEPLDMKGVAFTSQAALRTGNCASPHRLNEFGGLDVIPRYRMDVPDPAGSIHANARDLARWVRFQLGDGRVGSHRLVSEANLAETHTPQMVIRMKPLDQEMYPETGQMSYGMAWVIQDYRSRKLVSHAGAIDGFRVHLTLVPEARLGLVFLSNLHQTRMNQALSNKLLDLLLGLPSRDWDRLLAGVVRRQAAEAAERQRQRLARRQQGTHPSRELAAYAGSYEHPAYGTVQVSLEGGSLAWRWNSFRANLAHYHYDTFTLPIEILGNPPVVFTLNARGTVARMKVLGNMNVEFNRVGAKQTEERTR